MASSLDAKITVALQNQQRTVVNVPDGRDGVVYFLIFYRVSRSSTITTKRESICVNSKHCRQPDGYAVPIHKMIDSRFWHQSEANTLFRLLTILPSAPIFAALHSVGESSRLLS